MSDTLAGLLQIGSLLVVLALIWKPLGDYLAWVYSSAKHLRVEKAVYKLVGVDADAEQRWPVYLRGLLAFSVVGILVLYLLQRVQQWLPLDQGMAAVPSDIAFNTSVSFVTNTNWQSYAGESTMSHLTQMAGLAVQNFVSAAVGIAVAIAVIRGFVRVKPIAAQTLGGVVQNLPGGPVASQEIIKELGTNGGGFFNANAAHPFENPNPFTSWFQLLLILSIPVALTRTFGKLVGDRRQGRGDPGHDVDLRDRVHRSGLDLRGGRLRSGDAAGRNGHGGQGDPVRDRRLVRLRGDHHADFDRVGQLLPRLLHTARRRGHDRQHAARRDRSGHPAGHYLRVYLAQVRRKLEPDPSRPRYFHTEAGMGHRFVPGPAPQG